MNVIPEIVETEPIESEGITRLSEYIAICRRRFFLIVGVTFVFASIVALWSLIQIPVYQSIAGVVFEPPARQVIKMEMAVENEYRLSFDEEQFQTHVELLTSYPVLTETVKKLNLSELSEFQSNPSFFGKMLNDLKPEWLGSVRRWSSDIITMIQEWLTGPVSKEDSGAIGEGNDEFPDEEERILVAMLSELVSVEHVTGSKLVNIVVESESPQFSARVANALATVYIDRFHNAQSQETKLSAGWYASHLSDLRRKIEESEKALYAYRSKHRLVSVNEPLSTTEQQLEQVNLQLIEAESKRMEAEAKFERIENIWQKIQSRSTTQTLSPNDGDDLIGIVDSPAIQNFHNKQIELSVALAKLKERYGPLHPKMIQIQSELKTLKTGIAKEIEKAYRSVTNDYHLALKNEQAMRKRLEKQKAEKLLLDKYVAEYNILEREANSNRELFDAFLEQMKKTDLATEIQTSNMYLADAALPNMIPVEPRIGRNILMGIFGGLVAGVGLSFFLEFYDRSLKTPKDLELYSLGHPILGWVPRLPSSSQPNCIPLIEADPLSAAADCYRRIRTSVWLSSSHEEALSLAVTSPGEQEGKTTLAVNLAIAMSQLEGTQVVLIDADLRRPSVHKFFDMGNGRCEKKGLADYLAYNAEIQEILHQTRIPNVMLIPSGQTGNNHTELLHSDQLSKLIGWCRQHRYHVIIDTPPVLALVDSLVIANQVTGTILAVSAGETNRDATKIALQQITAHNGRVVGLVMQKVPQERIGYGLNTYWTSSYHTPSLFSQTSGHKLIGKSDVIKSG